MPKRVWQYGEVEPAWKRDRRMRAMLRERLKRDGLTMPKLATIVRVDLDRIWVPAWAQAKAIRDLTVTQSSVWLGRIAANVLARIDREAGGKPVLTPTLYRRCPQCDRALLGDEAQARWEMDLSYTGRQLPCGPECIERARALKARKKGQRKTDAGTEECGDVRDCEEDRQRAE